MLFNAICRVEKININLPSPDITATNVPDVVRVLRKDAYCHAQFLDQLMAYLQQTESPEIVGRRSWKALL